MKRYLLLSLFIMTSIFWGCTEDIKGNYKFRCNTNSDCPDGFLCNNATGRCTRISEDGSTFQDELIYLDITINDIEDGQIIDDTNESDVSSYDDGTMDIEEIIDNISDISTDTGTCQNNTGCGNNATCNGGVCECIEGYGNCNGKWEDGCEAYFKNDINHCGNCITSCGGNTLCDNGSCLCKPGFFNCNSIWSDGCESNIKCECGTGCGENAICGSNGCECNTGYENCNGLWSDGCEVNKNTDKYNCGYCNYKCGNNALCNNGTCECEPGGFANCNSDWGDGCETNLNSDILNCGTCGKACPLNSNCNNKSCICNDIRPLCGNSCCSLNEECCDNTCYPKWWKYIENGLSNTTLSKSSTISDNGEFIYMGGQKNNMDYVLKINKCGQKIAEFNQKLGNRTDSGVDVLSFVSPDTIYLGGQTNNISEDTDVYTATLRDNGKTLSLMQVGNINNQTSNNEDFSSSIYNTSSGYPIYYGTYNWNNGGSIDMLICGNSLNTIKSPIYNYLNFTGITGRGIFFDNLTNSYLLCGGAGKGFIAFVSDSCCYNSCNVSKIFNISESSFGTEFRSVVREGSSQNLLASGFALLDSNWQTSQAIILRIDSNTGNIINRYYHSQSGKFDGFTTLKYDPQHHYIFGCGVEGFSFADPDNTGDGFCVVLDDQTFSKITDLKNITSNLDLFNNILLSNDYIYFTGFEKVIQSKKSATAVIIKCDYYGSCGK